MLRWRISRIPLCCKGRLNTAGANPTGKGHTAARRQAIILPTVAFPGEPLGVVALLAGRGLITAAILRTMALTPDRWAVAVCDGAGGPSSSLIIRIDIAMQLSCNTVSQ